ncbi:MAG TPA: hypothetical protein VI386_23480 [Candidatus Sulfotelmatobacter sp.]
MKSRNTHSVASVAIMTLLACSFAVASQVEGPIMKGEVNHTISRAMREYAPARPAAQEKLVKGPARTAVLTFTGQSGKGQLYADPIGAVGTTQYVQLVNNQYTIYDKTTGAVIAGPIAENKLWSTFGSSCQTANNGDGTVNYDQAANVWILSHHAVPTGGPYLNCVAVSTSPDATGTYYLYAFELTQQYPDKPKIGVWPDAYYVSQDILNPSNKVFVRSQACALDRSAMIAGTFANSVCFQGSISLPTFMVTSWDGQTPPPSGEMAFFWELDQRPNQGRNNLNAFQFHADFTSLANNTFTGPVAIALPAYSDTCPNFKPCIPQLDTTNLVQGWGDRVTYRITYRNFGTYESIVMTHSVTQGSGTAAHAAIRWYEFRTPLTPVIYQWQTYSPDKTTWRWVPSIAQDQYGDIAVGYNTSGTAVHPGVAYTGRVLTDKLSTMEAETSVIVGGGSQQATNQNWSSYTSMTLDPVDDCTFWYTAPYYAKDSLETWTTVVTSFRFPSCPN